jgi:hypothetical protein
MLDRYKITLIVQSDEDPSAILDAFTDAINDRELPVDMRLDEESEEDGEAVSVEEL